MESYEERKKRLEDEDKKRGDELMAKAREKMPDIDNSFVFQLLKAVTGLASTVGDEVYGPVERQIFEVLGERIDWLSPFDKIELAKLSPQERTEALLKLKKSYEQAAGPLPSGSSGQIGPGNTEQDISESELEKALFPDLQRTVKTAEMFYLYRDKVIADVEWRYRNQPERLTKVKSTLNQLFLRYQHDRGW